MSGLLHFFLLHSQPASSHEPRCSRSSEFLVVATGQQQLWCDSQLSLFMLTFRVNSRIRSPHEFKPIWTNLGNSRQIAMNHRSTSMCSSHELYESCSIVQAGDSCSPAMWLTFLNQVTQFFHPDDAFFSSRGYLNPKYSWIRCFVFFRQRICQS